MAYQTRQRDPLLDSNMQAAIERRGKELLGLVVIAMGVMAAMMIASYTPEDPSWLLASDAPVQNWLGRFGASVAQPLFMIVGWGAWGIPLVLVAWGLRLTLHLGEERAVGRLIFAPIAVALGAVYASTLAPSAEWTHSFGLGGLFGDTVLSIILTMMPFSAMLGVKFVSLVVGMVMIGLGAFVLGFTFREMRTGLRFVLVGLVLSYALLVQMLGRGAAASLRGAQSATNRVQSGLESRREAVMTARGAADPVATRAVPAPPPAPGTPGARNAAIMRAGAGPNPVAAAPAQPTPAAAPLAAPARATPSAPPRGLRALMPSLLRRNDSAEIAMPEPELVEAGYATADVAPVDDARLRARIGDVIRNRLLTPAAPGPVRRQEPSLTAGNRPSPLAMNLAPRASLGGVPPLPQDSGAGGAHDFGDVLDDDAQDIDYHDIGDGNADSTFGAGQTGDWRADREGSADDRAPLLASPLFETEEGAGSRPATAKIPVPDPRKVVQSSARRPVAPSTRARSEAQPGLRFDDRYPAYEYPPLDLLTSPGEVERHHLSNDALEENARMLESVLDDYGVKGEIVSVRPGPVVTMYELEPAPGLKASRVIGLADDIARSMSALSARVSTVPGRSVIGIELPNVRREKVVLREILSARDFGDSNMRLPLALGKDIGGEPIIANLAKMPHLLIAGTTGSGKSVAINTMILSLLYKLTPEECRLIMIDPKMLELSVYDGIPHLLSPVVTDPKKAVVALKWVVGEMEERYRKMSKMGVRNIEGYNGRVRDALSRGEMFSRTVQTGFDDETGDPIFETEEFQPEVLPYIVVIVDEMADLMMVAGKEIEACIQRLAQMARASGIHLIMATQRPSVDVITGTIKANFPTRISFQVTSKIDSRTILGEQGAEQLLGMGDMLYMAGGSKITRIHGPFCSDEEVEEIVNFLKGFGPPEYMSGVIEGPDEDSESSIDQVLGLAGSSDSEDALYDTAVHIVAKDRKCSTSYIQRKLAIGYNKAARLVEQMEDAGVVSAANHVGKREILVPEVH